MTTIAYRDGVMAADTRMCSGNQFIDQSMTKIARNKAGDLCGISGDAALGGPFLEWFLKGERGKHPPIIYEPTKSDIHAVIVRAKGTMRRFEPGGWFYFVAPYFAMGSGRDFALGAMHMGADAIRAVQAGCAHDPSSGGQIILLRHDGAL